MSLIGKAGGQKKNSKWSLLHLKCSLGYHMSGCAQVGSRGTDEGTGGGGIVRKCPLWTWWPSFHFNDFLHISQHTWAPFYFSFCPCPSNILSLPVVERVCVCMHASCGKIHKALTPNKCFRGRSNLWPPLSVSVILPEVIGQKEPPSSSPPATSPPCAPLPLPPARLISPPFAWRAPRISLNNAALLWKMSF